MVSQTYPKGPCGPYNRNEKDLETDPIVTSAGEQVQSQQHAEKYLNVAFFLHGQMNVPQLGDKLIYFDQPANEGSGDDILSTWWKLE